MVRLVTENFNLLVVCQNKNLLMNQRMRKRNYVLCCLVLLFLTQVNIYEYIGTLSLQNSKTAK